MGSRHLWVACSVPSRFNTEGQAQGRAKRTHMSLLLQLPPSMKHLRLSDLLLCVPCPPHTSWTHTSFPEEVKATESETAPESSWGGNCF